MSIENISREELRKLISEIVRDALESQKPIKKKISPKHYSNTARNFDEGDHLENLIGSIPFILLDKKIFEKNMDVVEFADKIGIKITRGEKKKIDEIVGIVIVAINEFPPSRIKQLNEAISKLKIQTKQPSKKNKTSFFEEWDKVIKNM